VIVERVAAARKQRAPKTEGVSETRPMEAD
jgi:hypothetical protein